MSAPSPRDRLAVLAHAAGYDATGLELIAQTALPGFTPGQRLSDAEVDQVIDGLDVLRTGRMEPAELPAAVAHYRNRFAEPDWRLRFWRAQLSLADRHDAQPPPPAPAPVVAAAAGAPVAVAVAAAPEVPAVRTAAPPRRGVAGVPAVAARPVALVAPTRLPPRYDGEAILHLSHSSHAKWASCPEAFRRHYLLGERHPSGPAMVLGAVVDRALGAWAACRVRGERPELGDVLAMYDAGFEPALAEQEHGVRWTAEEPLERIRSEGRSAVETAITQLVPYLGRPVSTQRRVEFRVSPQHEWTIQGYLDLETRRLERVAVHPKTGAPVQLLAVDGTALGEPPVDRELPVIEREVHGIVDWKVKKKLISQLDADKDFQPTVYLTGVAVGGTPAADFTFAVTKRAAKNGTHATGYVRTTRTAAQQRAVFTRFAVMARAIVAMYERVGPDTPWTFANPTDWRCGPRWCGHWDRCAAGGGA